jgi:signal transduction histidine kinase
MRDIPGENNKENIQAIIEEASRLSELVNDLLDISKLESNTDKLEAEFFDITEAINSVISRYERLSSTEKYSIVFNYETKVNVLADRGMMLQVVYNLINNAINYGGKDRFVGVDQRIIVGESGVKTVRISVEDHGEGIDPDKIPFIWDRYYKIEGVHRRAMIGTGLGLSIVKKALEKHGAAYGGDSEIGKGSTFWFELPVWEV